MGSFRRTTVGTMLFAIPPVIRVIVVSCTVIWLVELLTWRSWQSAWSLLALSGWEVVHRLTLWQLVTYQFLHDPASPAHVVFNMLTLWMFGRSLEPRWGPWPFLQFYLVCGIGAGLLHVLAAIVLPWESSSLVLGASGAVLGVLTAYAMIWPRRQVALFMVFPIEARFLVPIFAVIELIFAFIQRPGGVANFAHLGGILTAYLYLKHGWRLRRLGNLRARVSERIAGWRRARRRGRMRVVDADIERLMRDSEDDTRH